MPNTQGLEKLRKEWDERCYEDMDTRQGYFDWWIAKISEKAKRIERLETDKTGSQYKNGYDQALDDALKILGE
jgi:hypothetical protein